ncbi:PARP-domain-containing protein [Delitschia confertaspora ATCC 74209]|uniref:Poly [ADP-ribose] polymerase n=1 Tax=Delitschia confertaspora ATCC 74209 TaxID=1513339 RepID=A0A9P4JSC3_9PLEO|nr:PARP-domain-containing protein [Delitschia confertaspora ATCC 74209]
MARKSSQLPLSGSNIAIVGTFPGTTQSALQDSITSLGATVAKSVTADTTCLVASPAAFAKPPAKVKAAQEGDIPIVSIEWLNACIDSASKKDFDSYVMASGTSSSSKTNSKKRAPSSDASPAPHQSQSQPNKKSKPEPKMGEESIIKSRDIVVPLDEGCTLPTTYRVYIDDRGVIYDASLNQTNASANNNKFYRVQVRPSKADYKTWTRWGRVGERGQTAVLGDGSLEEALTQFDKKFKDKSGLKWEDRGADPKPKKYAYVERSYAPDSDDEGSNVNPGESDDEYQVPESKLDVAVQSLMQLIFNQNYMNQAMSALNYDAQKMPLGKLSKATIHRGFQALKDLSNLFGNVGTSRAEIEGLSNRYYSLIPHDFGRNRPPVIGDSATLKRELELLESLGDMKEAAELMKKDLRSKDTIHPLDRQFNGLGLEEMNVLDSASKEYKELASYLVNTTGATHGIQYQIESIFRIERQGEVSRFEESEFSKIKSDRRLLWHGSRVTNFGGILSQGLRIAPPEAPVSGYMFGKGIYLADMSSKSANYCCSYNSDGHALLLLCEAELGDPMQKLTGASYEAAETARESGCWSTWGQGSTGPSKWKDAKAVHPSLKGVKMPDTTVRPGDTNVPGAYLQYNEYIAYDVAQVRLRYLFRVKM